MACFAATFAVVVLLGFISVSADKKDACDVYAAVGQSPVLPFSYEKLTSSHVLRWTHNNTIVFYRQGRVSVGKPDDVSAAGSLQLRNVKFSSAGAYRADALQPNGTLAKTWAGRLCVVDKAPKPEVRYVCDFKFSAVNLDCVVAKPEGLAFSWTLDKKTLPGETRQAMRISLNQLKGERSFTCSVVNRASQETSDTVHPACKSPPPPPLLCFTDKTVKAAAAGGAALVLLLITIIVVHTLLMCLFLSQWTLEIVYI
uniref:Ig-like domain-containing protein n=1 Tax=Salarias fasciatus TaxID=181472 RepID=A0A672JLW4_SALFA